MSITLVKTPNLPEKRVKDCIIGSSYSAEIKELTELGLNCIPIPHSELLSDEITSHADIQVFNKGDGELIVIRKAGEKLKAVLPDFKLLIEDGVQSPYPDDVKLNAAFIGDKIICNKSFISKKLSEFVSSNNIEMIHTKQGYSRCSLCIVNENAVITDDPGLAYLLKNYQFDVLKISSGQIYLSEAHSGFIGGASGKISEKEIYFSGNIENHQDFDKIKGFLDNYNISMIYNKFRKLTDFGGFIQLTEYD